VRQPVPAEQVLASDPGGDPVVHLGRGHVRRPADQGPGVGAGLQQSGYRDGLEVLDRDGLILVIDQGQELPG
jgi:hypothetical protein